jgi:hypothetical protein
MNDKIQITESLSIRKESSHLLNLHRETVHSLLCKSNLDQTELMEVLVSLHIVLEIGINTFFRQIFLSPKNRAVFDQTKIIDNLDNINFGDKVALFIYSSEFDFDNDEIEIAKKFHKIIGEIKQFSAMRNKLLHGHGIIEIYEEGGSKKSALSKELNLDKLKKQIESFKLILDGLSFYFKHYTQGRWTKAGKQQYIDAYLDTKFLPTTNFISE